MLTKMNGLWCIALFCLIFAPEIHSSNPNKDFCLSKPNGRYPNPTSCSSYVNCVPKTAKSKDCPKGRMFDPIAKKCRKPRSSGKMDCDVAIVGGGFSGLYMAYRLLKDTQEKGVCVFEKDSRLGGRLYDFFFDETPEISVGLGGWRIDTTHELMLDLVRELGLVTYSWTFQTPYTHESRGIFTTDNEKLIEAYPALRKSEFGNMTSGEMFAYVWEDMSEIDDYATLKSFVNHRISPEGAEFLSEVDGYKADYQDFLSPRGFYEWLEATADSSHEYLRPVGGMSALITALEIKLKELGASIYTCNEVRSIGTKNDGYLLRTNFNTVNAGKLVVAIPPFQLKRVHGSVAGQLQDSPELQSIVAIAAFKGGALFSSNTWSHLTAHQDFISNSDCLGQSFLHMGSGSNDEDVMHTLYTDGHCARMWRDVQSLGKDFLDKEVHRALEYKFNMTVPQPLETVYQYWEAAWHYQKGGTAYTMAQVADWAAAPLQGEHIVVVGEAYALKRCWCEGVMESCGNALEQGWGLGRERRRDGVERRITREELVERLRHRAVPIPHA